MFYKVVQRSFLLFNALSWITKKRENVAKQDSAILSDVCSIDEVSFSALSRFLVILGQNKMAIPRPPCNRPRSTFVSPNSNQFRADTTSGIPFLQSKRDSIRKKCLHRVVFGEYKADMMSIDSARVLLVRMTNSCFVNTRKWRRN